MPPLEIGRSPAHLRRASLPQLVSFRPRIAPHRYATLGLRPGESRNAAAPRPLESRMPSLEFKGKPFVYSHHFSVPFRELVIDAKKSVPGGKKSSLDDNLIIHGDNLEALKAPAASLRGEGGRDLH
jgi:hypothetical protein